MLIAIIRIKMDLLDNDTCCVKYVLMIIILTYITQKCMIIKTIKMPMKKGLKK
jgi:hypothetical protein